MCTVFSQNKFNNIDYWKGEGNGEMIQLKLEQILLLIYKL